MSSLLVPSLRAGHLFRRTSLLGPDDGPALFAKLDQSDHARLYALNIVDERRFLAFLARHCLERILAGHERDVRHSLLEGLEPGLSGEVSSRSIWSPALNATIWISTSSPLSE